jgi:hypothetical protein
LVTKDGVRRELVWPPRYAARFNPDLEVLNEKAMVVFRQGDLVRGGCVKGPAENPGDLILIRPEDLVNAGG